MSSLAFSHEISPFLEGTADEKKLMHQLVDGKHLVKIPFPIVTLVQDFWTIHSHPPSPTH